MKRMLEVRYPSIDKYCIEQAKPKDAIEYCKQTLNILSLAFMKDR